MVAVNGKACTFIAIVMSGEHVENPVVKKPVTPIKKVENLICEKFVETKEDESGRLLDIKFKNTDTFNFDRSSNRYLRMGSIIIGIMVGYVVSLFCDMVDFTDMPEYSLLNVPLPFRYGISFNVSAILAFAIVYVITAIEAYGDITANSLISGEPVEGKAFLKRAQGGILADGVNSFIAGALNSFPNSIFAQNNGMIQLTGVASRYVGYFIALFLVLLGFFPVVGVVFSFMPDPVLGGATLLMFGTVASAGV